MNTGSSRIQTTHVGSLVRPPELLEKLRPKEGGQPHDAKELAAQVRASIAEVVRKQAEEGVDIPSDGECGKPTFAGYARRFIFPVRLRVILRQLQLMMARVHRAVRDMMSRTGLTESIGEERVFSFCAWWSGLL